MVKTLDSQSRENLGLNDLVAVLKTELDQSSVSIIAAPRLDDVSTKS